jgi:uncharacterized protein GlcG (DUF336 family)
VVSVVVVVVDEGGNLRFEKRAAERSLLGANAGIGISLGMSAARLRAGSKGLRHRSGG